MRVPEGLHETVINIRQGSFLVDEAQGHCGRVEKLPEPLLAFPKRSLGEPAFANVLGCSKHPEEFPFPLSGRVASGVHPPNAFVGKY